ncbi:hypothetical protein X275_05635 [Marinitoga sp. 1197]|uniref:hypothetical protein n=1 Tax=Marinitoga sp. 1197 TaxID=1428449 RepID=UPI00064134DD|nr:hypothetical protein [Marinitoga sp. 1197]KLO22757.1 hypothetical protein X275_05635 [Marinitoga sp. 1197]
MKKRLFLFILVFISVFTYGKTLIGGYYWSDIFFGFSGVSIYGGVEKNIDFINLEETIGIKDNLLTFQYFYGVGINYLKFDPTVLGIGDYTLNDFALKGIIAGNVGIPLLSFSIFDYNAMPAVYLELNSNYYFSELTVEDKNKISGLVLSDHIAITYNYGAKLIFNPKNLNSKFIIRPIFFPWPFIIGAEVLF